MAFAPLAASAHPEFSTRERVAFQTKPAMCDGCHGLINPLGFTLERYDAIGRVRATDNGKPVDDGGFYVPPHGAKVAFHGEPDLARYLADGDESHAAFVEKLFLNMVRQAPTAYGPRTLPDLQRSFEKNGLDVRGLMVSIAGRRLRNPMTPSSRRGIPAQPRPRRRGPAPHHGPSLPRGRRRRSGGASSGLVVLFSPDGVVPSAFWPDAEGPLVLKGSLKPLEPFRDRTLVLKGLSDKVRGRRRWPYARHRLPAHGRRAFPRERSGRLRHARRVVQRHLDRPSRSATISRRGPPHAHPVRLAGVRRHGARKGRHLDPDGLRGTQPAGRPDRRPVRDVRQALRADEGQGGS